jgi:hypothetical protein
MLKQMNKFVILEDLFDIYRTSNYDDVKDLTPELYFDNVMEEWDVQLKEFEKECKHSKDQSLKLCIRDFKNLFSMENRQEVMAIIEATLIEIKENLKIGRDYKERHKAN